MTRQSRLTGRVLGASALLCLSFALSAAIGPAAANQVGVAAAVNPDAFSSLAGAPKSQLNIGKSIFFNERIATTTSGLVQVLLVDGSTFTVGPDSDLVIDKFVYDPNKGTGQIAASFSKGVMRFVGGKISKSDNAVTIKTPAGAMAVRGCIILTQVTSSSFAAVLVYGDYLKIKNFVVYEPGNGLFISATGNAEVRKATAADIGGMTAALSSSNTQNQSGDASSKTTTGTTLQMVDTASLNELVQNANTQEVVASAENTTNNEPPPPPPCVGAECNPPPPPPPPCEGVDCGTPRGQLQGYAGGVYVTEDHVDNPDLSNNLTDNQESVHIDPEYGTVANHSADEVNFTFNEDGDDNASNDTFSARFRLHAGEPNAPSEGGILMNFGDRQPPGEGEEPRSFIDPLTGALLASNGPDNPDDADEQDGITIFHDNDEKGTIIGEPVAVLASSENFAEVDPEDPPTGPSTNVVPIGSNDEQAPPLPELCTDCDFMKWGVFATAATFEEEGEGETPARDLGIEGFWVAGDIAAVGDLPFTGEAFYSGGAVGRVSTDLFGSQETYTARGDMEMEWNFAQRSGDMTISRFDDTASGGHFEGGLNFQGKMCAPGVTGCGRNTPPGNHFGGPLNGRLPDNVGDPELPEGARDLNGFALGSFARGPDNYDNGNPKTGTPVKGSTPQGVMGNWQVGTDSNAPAGSRYQASGVFAGKHRGTPQ